MQIIPLLRMILAVAMIFALSSIPFSDSAYAQSWYIRGQAGYEQSLDADFSDTNCASAHPPALFGCAAGPDGRPIGAYGDFGRYPLLEIAAGRTFLPWLRADLSLAYRFGMDYQGQANFLSVGAVQPVSAKAESFAGLVNLFIDLNGFFKPGTLGRFSPYVGGGLGLACNRLGEMTFVFPQNPGAHKISIVPAGEKTDFAFALAVGTGFALTENLILDIAWRYIDLGRVQTDPGGMWMNTLPSGLAISNIETRLKSHGPSLGLRVHF